MKIGIYMAYGPNTVLGKEGLGRYIGNLIKGFVDAGHQVTIACPKWSLETIDDLFQDFHINTEQTEFVVSYKTPALWRLYEGKYKKKHPKNKLKDEVFSKMTDILENTFNQIFSVSSMVLFIILMAGLVLLGLVLGVLLFPLLLLGVIGLFVYKIGKMVSHKGEFLVRQKIKSALTVLQTCSKNKWTDWHMTLIEKRDTLVGKSLVEKVNHVAKPQDVWFVPALFWPETAELNGRKVVCAPDIVTIEFPMLFSQMHMVPSTKRCQKVIEKENYFITYCEYIRNSLLIERYGKKEDHVISIPHINNAMNTYLEIDVDKKKLNTQKDLTTAFAKAVIRVAKYRYRISPENYMNTFHTDGMKYIFYSSQARAHKNMLTLVKAYAYLLRHKYAKIKLVLTGDYSLPYFEQIYTYVMEHRLQYDILCLYSVTAQELAALYKCAELVVNPTFYEGGFPFTFGEGMSVGTPSVMSDIPQVREVVEPYGLADEMLFDPYDYRAMAEKIEYGLQHREELYQKQLPLYRGMEKRTADVVAQEYIAAFETFIELEEGRCG